jgi:hypothetical protein
LSGQNSAGNFRARRAQITIHVDEPILAAAGPPEGSTADLGQAHADVDDSRSKVWRNKAHINKFEWMT